MPARPVALLAVLLLAGCLGAAVDEPLRAAGVPAALGLSARVPLQADCAGACPLARLDAPQAAPGALLEVRLAWDGALHPGFGLRVVGPDGAVHEAARGFDAVRVLVEDPLPGAYLVEALGDGPAAGWAELRQRGEPRHERDLLPNLVTLVPVDVGVALCDPWEVAEQGARRCLRLGNAVGNTGDGPLEVRLAAAEGLLVPTGTGSFVQRILQREGAPREVPVGGAHLHATHAHFHYDGLARFTLHEVDLQTGLRGEPVARHGKAGFCLLDVGEMQEPDVEPERSGERRAEQACLVPGGAEGWSMGVSRGWYDLYGRGLTDQYVEVSGVPDGVYELVSEADWQGTLLELDEGDNAASVLLRLQGDRVEVLEERGFHRVPEDG